MKKIILSVLSFTSICITSQAQDTIYVDAAATGNNDGTSWANAYNELYTPIGDGQTPNISDKDEIWIAKGTYVPANDFSTPYYREFSFFINADSIKIYGGFSGGETSIDERDVVNNLTVLSGDLNANDTEMDFTSVQENSYTILTIGDGSLLNYFLIDGVTIEKGNSSFAPSTGSGPSAQGAGIYIDGGISEVKISNCIIQKNRAHNRAGICAYKHTVMDLNISIENCRFYNNAARYSAAFGFGAFDGRTVNVDIINCLIDSNKVKLLSGGNFWTNTSTFTGSGGDLLAFDDGIMNARIINTTFTNNIENGTNTNEKGILFIGGNTNVSSIYSGEINVDIDNSIFWNNSISKSFNKAIYPNDATSITINNTITADTITAAFVSLNNNLHLDPLFVNNANDFSLTSGSPAIDEGGVNGLSGLIPANDLNGMPRIDNNLIDLGCYEFEQIVNPGVGIEDFLDQNDFRIYPNPVSSVLNIVVNSEVKTLTIFNVNGKVEKTIKSSTNAIDVNDLKEGMYIIQLETKTGISYSRFIKL